MPTAKVSAKKLDKKALLTRIRARYKAMTEADSENRKLALDDLRFLHIPGEQWDQNIKSQRGTRPCYEFNKTLTKVKRVVNEMRANRPAGKVRAIEDSDKKMADIREGLCRNIWNVSDGDTITDYAAEYQVACGMGAWRVCTDYEDEDSFTQEIRIEAIKNPFCLYADPASQDPLKRDADDWILTDKLSKKAYEAKYGDAEKSDFEGDDYDDSEDWEDEKTIRVCEYWYKEPYDKEIWQLKDGRVVAADDKAANTVKPGDIAKRRISKCDRIMMCIASGKAILEGPTVQAGRNHRFIVVYGKWIVIGGKIYWSGLTRQAKDAQRSYNVERTAIVESVATSPNSHFFATTKQAEGNTDLWNQAIGQNLPYLLYTADPQANGPPQRMAPAFPPAGSLQILQLADQELKDCMGVYDAALGERSNENSGIAISRRAEQTQIVNFNFPDNMGKGVKRTWEIINDLIPEIIDTERAIRVLGADGAEDYLVVNKAVNDPVTGEPVVLNDLSAGKFDVTVTVGPSYATQRQEAAEFYSNMAQTNPQLMQIGGDLIMKSQDVPYADEFAERLQTLLPPQIQEMLNKDKQVPPEVAQMMAQAKQAMAQVQQAGQMVQAAAAEATTLKTEAEKSVSDLNVKQAQFDADVIKEFAKVDLAKANLALAEAQAQAKGITADTAANQAAFETLMKQTVAEIQTMGAQFMQAAAQTMADIQSKQAPQVIVHAPPRPRITALTRSNGQLVPQYEDQAPTQAPPVVQ